MNAKEIMANIFRNEELVLESIYQIVTNHHSKPPTDDANDVEDKRMAELGYAITTEEIAHRNGYSLGWWEAVEVLRLAIAEYTEGNEARLFDYK